MSLVVTFYRRVCVELLPLEASSIGISPTIANLTNISLSESRILLICDIENKKTGVPIFANKNTFDAGVNKRLKLLQLVEV